MQKGDFRNFIIFTGMDGTGKLAQITRALAYLHDKFKDKDVFLTKEPSKGPFGLQIRKRLFEDKEPFLRAEEYTELYVKDRYWHVHNIIVPAIERGDIVISDRYYYETLAYQQTQGIDFARLLRLNSQFPKPGIAFLLDVPAEIAVQRITKRGSTKTKFEQIEFMEQLRKNFLSLPSQIEDNLIVIDATPSADEIFEKIKEYLDRHFGLS